MPGGLTMMQVNNSSKRKPSFKESSRILWLSGREEEILKDDIGSYGSRANRGRALVIPKLSPGSHLLHVERAYGKAGHGWSQLLMHLCF